MMMLLSVWQQYLHMHSKSRLIIDIFVRIHYFYISSKNLKMHIVDFYNKAEKEEQEINEILDYDSEIENCKCAVDLFK